MLSIGLVTLAVDQWINYFVADGTNIVHRSCFDFWDFWQTFYKMIYGMFSSLARCGLVLGVSVYSLFMVYRSALPHSLSFLDPAYTSFVSMILVTEKQNNPTLRAVSHMLASMEMTISRQRGRTFHSRDLAAPYSLVNQVYMKAQQKAYGNGPREWDDGQVLEHTKLKSMLTAAGQDTVMLDTIMAWKQMQIMYILLANPSLSLWSDQMVSSVDSVVTNGRDYAMIQ